MSLLSIQKKWKWSVILQHLPENDVYKDCCKMSLSFILLDYNRPFAASHSHGTKPLCWREKLHWDKTNKENYHLKLCMSFVCLVPVRLLLSSMAVLYNVNGQLQRAYYYALEVKHITNYSLAECDFSSTVLLIKFRRVGFCEEGKTRESEEKNYLFGSSICKQTSNK